MKRWISFLILGCGVLLLALLVMVSSQMPVSARQDATPTLALLGDSLFADKTPTAAGQQSGGEGAGGGLLIPTSTPIESAPSSSGGGLVIPTSTPVAGGPPPVPALPPLGEEGLLALLIQPADVPAEFAANRETGTFMMSDTVANLNNAGQSQLATELQSVIDEYGWVGYTAVQYTSCQPDVPVSEIYSDASQLKDPHAARRFVDDPRVRQLLASVNASVQPADMVHGWWTVSQAESGDCVASQIEYTLNFEYWGLLVSVSMTADASTDPALVQGLLDQLTAVIVGRVDALAGQPFPPTPQPGGPLAEAPPAGGSGPQPTPALPLPTPAPPLLPPAPAARPATLQDIERVMPTMQELGMEPPWQVEGTLSGIYTPQQLVALFKSAGLLELATVTERAMQQYGQIGQVARLWSTGTSCPEPALLGTEIDVALFETAQGAAAMVNDTAIQQAWINTGLFNDIRPSGDGMVWLGSSTMHQCGTVQFYNKIVAQGRFMILVSLTASASADPAEVGQVADLIVDFMIQKLDQAGLQ